MSVAALLFACALAASPSQQPDTSDPSLDRIRTGLAKPPSKLTVPERVPDFSVTIRERSREKELLPPILDFKVGPGVPQEKLFTSPVGSQPLFQVDLMPAGIAVADAIKQLESLELPKSEKPAREAHELRNLHALALLIARSGLAREESRGSHYRSEFPFRNDEKFGKHSLMQKNNEVRFEA